MSLPEPIITPEPVPDHKTQDEKGQHIAQAAPTNEPTPSVRAIRDHNNISGNNANSLRDTIYNITNTYHKDNAEAKDIFLGEFNSLEKYIHDLPEADVRIKPADELVMGAVEKLKANNLILLDGFHGPVLDSIAVHISYNETFSNYSKKIVCIDDFSSRIEKFTLHDFIYGLAAQLSNTLLVVYIETGSVSALAMKELIGLGDTSRSKTYGQDLGKLNVYCIFLTWNSEFVKKFTGKFSGNTVLRCNIPWMPYLLHRHFLQEECVPLYNEIELLRRLDFWNYTDEYSFFKEIEYAVLSNTLKVVIEEGKDWERKSPEERLRLKKERIAVTSPARIFEKDDPLILYLVFLVSYFPDLTVNEFRVLVETILEGETVKTDLSAGNKTATTITASFTPVTALVPVNTNNTVMPSETGTKTISLIEKWNAAPDSYLQKAGIRSIYSENKGFQIIDFEDGNFREKCKAYLELHYFITVEKLIDKLFLEKGQLFVWEEDSRMFSNLIHLACYFADKNPDHSCMSLLLVSTIGVSGKKLVYKGDLNDANALWEFVEANWEYEAFKENSLGRLSKLIIGMLRYPKLYSKLDDFFEKLIHRKYYHAVLLLLSKLPPASPIDVIGWFRFLINNGPSEIKIPAFERLVQRVIKCPPDELLTNLKTIWSWINRNEKLVSEDSFYGLVFIVNYLSRSILQLSHEHFGKWPSHFNLFKNADLEQEWKEKLDLFFKWITHKELENACRRFVGDGWDDWENWEKEKKHDHKLKLAAYDVLAWQALAIEELFVIANGLKPGNDDEAKAGYLNNIKEKFSQYFDVKAIKKIRSFWASCRTELLKIMTESKSDAEYYALLKDRRQHLQTIINYTK